MALWTYLDHSGESTPTTSPRTVNSTPDYDKLLHAMEKSAGIFEQINATGDLRSLSPSSVILLLTPVILSEMTADRKIDTQHADPFEMFGKKLSIRHSRVRHVPYSTKHGLTETHRAFAREAGAIVYITMQNVETSSESARLCLEQERRSSRAKPIIHLGFSQMQSRADSPYAGLAQPDFPTEQDFDQAIKLLYES